MKRITKDDLANANVYYYDTNRKLIDSRFDSFDSLAEAMNGCRCCSHVVKYVEIINRENRVVYDYAITRSGKHRKL